MQPGSKEAKQLGASGSGRTNANSACIVQLGWKCGVVWCGVGSILRLGVPACPFGEALHGSGSHCYSTAEIRAPGSLRGEKKKGAGGGRAGG